MNVSNKIPRYMKILGMTAVMGLSTTCIEAPTCKIQEAEQEIKPESHVTQLLSRLESGEEHSVYLQQAPNDRNVVKLNEISKYIPNDSVGELFYQVYVGKADTAIRKAKGKKGELLTLGQGVTGKGAIELANGEKARKYDYVRANSADSLMNEYISEKDSIITANVPEYVYRSMMANEKDAVISYLYNVNSQLLIKNPNGKSFFQYLSEGNKGMVQSKFNVEPSSRVAAAGLAKRNLVQMLIYGDGQIYDTKEAIKNFKKQVQIVRRNRQGEQLLREALDIVKQYGVNENNLALTEKMIFPEKNQKVTGHNL